MSKRVANQKSPKTNYEKLEIQEYLLDGNKNTKLSNLIFKARGKSFQDKTRKKWKYKDTICVGCTLEIETEDELLKCHGFAHKSELSDATIKYEMVIENSVEKMIEVAEEIRKRLKVRQKLLDEPG